MIVRPRAIGLPLAASLAGLTTGKSDDELRELVDFEISFGRRPANGGSGRIELSTLPWRQGNEIPDR